MRRLRSIARPGATSPPGRRSEQPWSKAMFPPERALLRGCPDGRLRRLRAPVLRFARQPFVARASRARQSAFCSTTRYPSGSSKVTPLTSQ